MLILAGKTCSGKTTLLYKFRDLGFRVISTFTTRPKRDGEQNGENYYFISEDDFRSKIEQGFFAEYTKYNVASGETWYYGTSKESLKGDGVIILNPDGVKAVSKLDLHDAVICYIKCEDKTLENRLTARGDNEAEAQRRLKADKEDFNDFDKYAHIIVHNDTDTDIKTLCDEVKSMYEYILKLIKCIDCNGVGVDENGRYCDSRCENGS